MKRIVSVWLPQWPIERLSRQRPGAVPDDKPFALVTGGAQGIRITAVNIRAAREGLRVGMSLADARAAVPSLISHPAEAERDAQALERLALWLGRYGPSRNVEGCDGVWIDTTGVAHLFSGEAALLENLVRRLSGFGITARAGLADTPGAAYALARFATTRRRTVMAPAGEAQTAAALAGLPVAALRLSQETAVLLKRLGLARIGQLVELPRTSLERRFSSESSSRSRAGQAKTKALADAVLLRLDQALGRQAEPRAALGDPPVLSERRSWGEPLISSEALVSEVGTLAGDLSRALKAAGLGARRIVLHLYRADGTIAHAEAGLARASAEATHFMQLLESKLAVIDAGFGIDVAVLDAVLAEPLDAEQATLGRGGAIPEQAIAALVDRLANRLGAKNVFRLAPRASYLPERATVRTVLLAPIADPAAMPGSPPGERPFLLLSPPEPISAMAEVPDGPPLRFTWRRVAYAVVKAAGPERIAPEWWRHLAHPDADAPTPADDGLGGDTLDPAAREKTRDYYVAETSDGARFWMYREGFYGAADAGGAPRWFLHGLF
ncbi:MAG: DNA polymerase Y family protein [Hyphomicrobium sp.]|nr:DNA polymerase Y family protein [Hyphomicrobium sp.]